MAGGDPTTIAQSVFDKLFPEQIIFSKGTGLNQSYLLPQEIDPGVAENALRVMMGADKLRSLIRPFDDPRYRQEIDVELDIVGLSSTGTWINNSTGDGVVLMYYFQDQMPIPVEKMDGSYYEVKFTAMRSIAQDITAADYRGDGLASGAKEGFEKIIDQYSTPQEAGAN